MLTESSSDTAPRPPPYRSHLHVPENRIINYYCKFCQKLHIFVEIRAQGLCRSPDGNVVRKSRSRQTAPKEPTAIIFRRHATKTDERASLNRNRTIKHKFL